MPMLLEINGILPATIIYSFLMSFFFLYYFSKEKENYKSWIIFIIATLHLTLVYFYYQSLYLWFYILKMKT